MMFYEFWTKEGWRMMLFSRRSRVDTAENEPRKDAENEIIECDRWW